MNKILQGKRGYIRIMRDSFFPALIILFQISVFVNILFIESYLKNRSKAAFRGFLFTIAANFVFTAILLVMFLQNPEIIYRFNIEEILLVEAGLIFGFLLFVQIRISLKIILRSRNPEYYDLNFFGKKVYKTKIISKGEVAAFVLSTPVAMFAGAYFFVRLLS